MSENYVKIVLSDGRVIQDGQLEYIIAKNGIFKKVETNILEGYFPVSGIPHLPAIQEQIKIKLPKKIPEEIYFKIFTFFSKFTTEVYAQIFWDGTKYFIYIPKQVVSGASVEYERNVKLERKNKLICEIHSHNTMGAFFSTTDDKDEQTGIIYGVISTGNLWSGKFRIKYQDIGFELQISDIFEIEEPPREWWKQVKNSEPQKQKYFNFGGKVVKNQVNNEIDNEKWWKKKEWENYE